MNLPVVCFIHRLIFPAGFIAVILCPAAWTLGWHPTWPGRCALLWRMIFHFLFLLACSGRQSDLERQSGVARRVTSGKILQIINWMIFNEVFLHLLRVQKCHCWCNIRWFALPSNTNPRLSRAACLSLRLCLFSDWFCLSLFSQLRGKLADAEQRLAEQSKVYHMPIDLARLLNETYQRELGYYQQHLSAAKKNLQESEEAVSCSMNRSHTLHNAACGMSKHPSPPFLDQTLCKHSRVQVGRARV